MIRWLFRSPTRYRQAIDELNRAKDAALELQHALEQRDRAADQMLAALAPEPPETKNE